jgi:hypothetical protein
MNVTAQSRTGLCNRRNLSLVATLVAATTLLGLVAAGCSGSSSSNLIVVKRTPTPTATPAPTATPTPIPVSATEAGTGAALQDFKASGNTLWASNETWLLRLFEQFAITPDLRQSFETSTAAAFAQAQFDRAVLQIAGAGFLSAPDDASLPPVYSPKIRSLFSLLAIDLHNFETSGLYGDAKDELPRASCDFTTNPKGICTPAANSLTIRFNDPTLGKNLVTSFDWTGASTGKSSPTVQAHDPLNPGTTIELPTRLIWQISSNGTILLNAVSDVQWLPSPCATGKFLFDIPVSADATGYIVGADLVAKILNGTVSAALTDTSGTGSGNLTGADGGKSITGSASTSITGTLSRAAKSCGAFENFDVSAFMVNGTGSDGPHKFDLSLSASDLVTGSDGVLQSGELDGQFLADSHLGTFSGTMDLSRPDKVPGHNLMIVFADAKNDFADFVHKFFGKHPTP